MPFDAANLAVTAHCQAGPVAMCTVAALAGHTVERLSEPDCCLLTNMMPNCRQAGSGFFCQAPQTPTYNFSTSGASGPGLPTTAGTGQAPATNNNNNNNNNGRRLSQTAAPAPAAGAGQCNQIAYYAPCGELCSPRRYSIPVLPGLPNWELPDHTILLALEHEMLPVWHVCCYRSAGDL